MTCLISNLRTELEQNGTLSFARFMELALYAPSLGYYERPRPIGQQGDFFTSVSVGPLFGELLAFQFAEWFLRESDSEKKLQLIEAGAHDGQLAVDILNGFKTHCPELFSKLEYVIVEPSEFRKNAQRQMLGSFQNIKWCGELQELYESSAENYRIIFSNELFDAMPMHRLGWDAQERKWFEWGVAWQEEKFVWFRLPKMTPGIVAPQLARELEDALPDGFLTEFCPAATNWWTHAAQVLGHGKLLAIDYGLREEEFFTPQRSNGTLRAYSHHHVNSDLLAHPGEQDLTAHINFSALQQAGERQGLKTEQMISQSNFLTSIAQKSWANPNSFGEWDGNRRKQFQTLTHPEHLGRGFRVLLQSR